MRASRLSVLVALAVLSVSSSAEAQRFPGSEDPSQSGFGAGFAAGYSFLGGEVGDSVSGGLRLQGTGFYDFEDTPFQAGLGAAYAWLGFDRADGTLGMLSLFGFGTYKFVETESSMIPYASLRLGWTRLSDDQPCGLPRCGVQIEGTRTRSGLDVGAVVGVDLQVSRKASVNFGGSFDWLFMGDYKIDGNWVDDGTPVSDTLPDSSQQGSAFTLFAGLQYYFSP